MEPEEKTLPPAPCDGDLGAPTPMPERIPANMVCLRGPCRHYWHYVTPFDCGNPRDTWAMLGIEPPKQNTHLCTAHKGELTDFAETLALRCNRWDPMTRKEIAGLKSRRDAFFKANPELDPEENKTDDR